MKIFLNSKSIMNENLTSKNIENSDFNLDTEESEYKKLISRLIEIKKTIILLENTIFK